MRKVKKSKLKLCLKSYSSEIYIKNIFLLDSENTMVMCEEKYQYDSSILFLDYLEIGKNLYENKYNNDALINILKDKELPLPTDDSRCVGYNISVYLNNLRTFIEDLYLLFAIDQLCKNFYKRKTINKEILDTLNKYLESFKWIEKLSNYIESNNATIDDIYLMLRNTNDFDINNKDTLCDYIRNAITRYVSHQYNLYPINQEIINIYNSKDFYGQYGFIRTVDNLRGILYYELMNYILPNRINASYSSCVHCGAIIYKFGNTKYCNTCRDNHIPDKIKNNKYENSDKGKKTRKAEKENKKKAND